MGFQSTPPKRIRPEGLRYLRSNGKPNFSSRIYEKPGELSIIIKRPVVTITHVKPIGEAIKTMTYKGFRRLPVTTPTGILKGIITATDIVNYFGGGEYFNIILNRYGGNIYKALNEPVKSIMNKNPIYITTADNLAYAIELMVRYGVGAVPIVKEETLKIQGIITERDIVNYLREKTMGLKVSELMTKNVITISQNSSIREAAKTIIKMGFRRLPIVDSQRYVKGMITARSIVRFFGTNKVFEYVISGNVEEALSAPVTVASISKIVTVEPHIDVGEAVNKMIQYNVGSVLVTENNKLIGILTERDVMYALALKR